MSLKQNVFVFEMISSSVTCALMNLMYFQEITLGIGRCFSIFSNSGRVQPLTAKGNPIVLKYYPFEILINKE